MSLGRARLKALAATLARLQSVAKQVVAAAQTAFTGGLNTAATVSAVIAGLAAIIAATRLRHVRPTGEAQQAAEERATS